MRLGNAVFPTMLCPIRFHRIKGYTLRVRLVLVLWVSDPLKPAKPEQHGTPPHYGAMPGLDLPKLSGLSGLVPNWFRTGLAELSGLP